MVQPGKHQDIVCDSAVSHTIRGYPWVSRSIPLGKHLVSFSQNLCDELIKQTKFKAEKDKKDMAKKKNTSISKRMQRRAEQRRKKRLTQLAFAAVALVVLVGGAWAIFGGSIAEAPVVEQAELPAEITVDEAFEIYEAGGYLLDVRTQAEWDDYHIPGTTLIPLDELASRADEVPSDQEIVVVCRSGNRSQEGRDILLDAGFTQVTSMDGGVSTWRSAGYPIE